MNGVKLPPAGCYIMAVSGGVDSVVLLDILAKDAGLELVVAHFNHAMRPEAGQDEELVRQLAKLYGFSLEIGRASPGVLKSEERARSARYGFLNEVREKRSAAAIITAHHQDDLIETALLNVLRGTNRKGLSAIATNPGVIRPLLDVAKKEVVKYAKKQQLTWLEDVTNRQNDYLRNYLRNKILSGLSKEQRDEIVYNLQNVAKINEEADNIIATISQELIIDNSVNRLDFINLPTSVGNEVLANWMASNGFRAFDRGIIGQSSSAIRAAKPGTTFPIGNRLKLVLTKTEAAIAPTDRNA